MLNTTTFQLLDRRPPINMSAVGAERAEVAVDLLRLAPRLVTEDGLRDRQHALLCIQEYQRFLTLAEVHRGVALTPSAAVEAVWQRHPGCLLTAELVVTCICIY